MRTYAVFNESDHAHPVVVSIPHSGTYIPEEIRQQLLPGIILPNMDWFLRELYDFLPAEHVTVIENNTSRYVADPNRDLHVSPTGDYHSLVYQKTTFFKPMYAHRLTAEEVNRRIKHYYKPYHQKLNQLLCDKLAVFEKVFLLDLHSFAIFGNPPVSQDFVLGNRNGTTTSKETVCLMKHLLIDAGYTVSDNYPFPGGYITRHYGTCFGDRVESMQLEICYKKYLGERDYDEEELTGWDDSVFGQAKKNLKTVFGQFLSYSHAVKV